jgi:hypothetical protein
MVWSRVNVLVFADDARHPSQLAQSVHVKEVLCPGVVTQFDGKVSRPS